jgi:ribosomal protein S18 acetylase RimI-like enzyme
MSKPLDSIEDPKDSVVLSREINHQRHQVDIRTYRDDDREQVVRLWKVTKLYHPDNDPYKDIDRKMIHSPNLFFVACQEGFVVGTVMVGYEGHRGWINYLGVLPEYQGRGIGRQLMETARNSLAALGCAKINLQIRKENLEIVRFYKSIGYVIEDVVSMEMRLEYDS